MEQLFTRWMSRTVRSTTQQLAHIDDLHNALTAGPVGDEKAFSVRRQRSLVRPRRGLELIGPRLVARQSKLTNDAGVGGIAQVDDPQQSLRLPAQLPAIVH